MVLIAARRVAYIKKQSAGSACKSTDRTSCCRFAMAANQRHGNHTISQPPAPAAHLNAWICPEARGPLVSPFACSYSAKKSKFGPPPGPNLADAPRRRIYYSIQPFRFSFSFASFLFSFLAKRKRKEELSSLTSYTSQRWRSSRPNGLPCPPPA